MYLEAARILKQHCDHPQPVHASIEWVFQRYNPLPPAQLQDLLSQHAGREDTLLTLLVKHFMFEGGSQPAQPAGPDPQVHQGSDVAAQASAGAAACMEHTAVPCPPTPPPRPQQEFHESASSGGVVDHGVAAQHPGANPGLPAQVPPDAAHIPPGPEEADYWATCIAKSINAGEDCDVFCLYMKEALTGCSGVQTWCGWAAQNLPRGVSWDWVDFSRNYLTDVDVEQIVACLLELSVLPRSLAFHDNGISCRGASALSQLILRAGRLGHCVRELHLSHNKIGRPGAKAILEAIALCRLSDGRPAYPMLGVGHGLPLPLWLRLEKNLIEDAANFEADAQQVLRAKRQEAGLCKPDTESGPMICEVIDESGQRCNKDYCVQACSSRSPSAVPIVHARYFTQQRSRGAAEARALSQATPPLPATLPPAAATGAPAGAPRPPVGPPPARLLPQGPRQPPGRPPAYLLSAAQGGSAEADDGLPSSLVGVAPAEVEPREAAAAAPRGRPEPVQVHAGAAMPMTPPTSLAARVLESADGRVESPASTVAQTPAGAGPILADATPDPRPQARRCLSGESMQSVKPRPKNRAFVAEEAAPARAGDAEPRGQRSGPTERRGQRPQTPSPPPWKRARRASRPEVHA